MKRDKDDWNEVHKNIFELPNIFEITDWLLDVFLPFLPSFVVLGLGVLIGWGIWH
jgi:hypothetical protein